LIFIRRAGRRRGGGGKRKKKGERGRLAVLCWSQTANAQQDERGKGGILLSFPRAWEETRREREKEKKAVLSEWHACLNRQREGRKRKEEGHSSLLPLSSF